MRSAQRRLLHGLLRTKTYSDTENLTNVMYAQLARKNYPLGWEELEFLERKLRTLNPNYQVGAEKWVFSTEDGLPRYRYVVLRWARDPVTHESRRETLCETEELQHACAVITMLIAVTEDELNKEQMEVTNASNSTWQ